MDLDDYHYHDGRPVSFDRTKVIHLEPHESGSGSFVRIGYEGGSTEMHLREEYHYLRDRLSDGQTTRIMRNMAEERGQPFDKKNMFNFSSGTDDETPF